MSDAILVEGTSFTCVRFTVNSSLILRISLAKLPTIVQWSLNDRSNTLIIRQITSLLTIVLMIVHLAFVLVVD